MVIEAFAECLHKLVRQEYWGYAKKRTCLTNNWSMKVIKEYDLHRDIQRVRS